MNKNIIFSASSLNELIVVTVKHPHDGSPGAERRQNLYRGTQTATPTIARKDIIFIIIIYFPLFFH